MFIKCSVEEIKLSEGSILCNMNLDISALQSIIKNKRGVTGHRNDVFAIEFWVNGCDFYWLYLKKKERDAEYDRIIKYLNPMSTEKLVKEAERWSTGLAGKIA